ncbi:DUF3907 family protein [Hazenella coriacea]|nr:DUF3907 family protein [Hazenella coriacea]
MPAEQTKQLCVLTREKLRNAKEQLENFLNYNSVHELMEENSSDPDTEKYICEFLSDLRHLVVVCELGYEKISLVLRRATFSEDFANKVLGEIVHSCVYGFYYPRNEVYEEDGRYSYTAQDAIRFREATPSSLQQLVFSLSKIFEYLRDELEYYETDYFTHIRLQTVQQK